MQTCETDSKGRMIRLLIWLICISKTEPASIIVPENNDDSPYGTEAAGDSPTGSLYHSRAYEDGAKLWPQGKVIYDIDESMNETAYRERIHLTAQAISNATCIKFIKRTRENEMLPYVSIHRYRPNGEKACESEIGFFNLHPQEIRLTPFYCYHHYTKFVGVLAHEFLHTLGFVHEFERTDRDAYLKVPAINGEIPPTIPGNTANLTFDFKSIMQYEASHGFKAVNPRPAGYPPPIGTISDMGHVCKLSASDRTLIDRIYAKECKLKHPEKIAYKDDWPLPTGACEGTIPYTKDEEMH